MYNEFLEAYSKVYLNEDVEQFDEALTGERLTKAKEMIARSPKSAKSKAVKRVADSQEGSDRGDTVPGDIPRNRSNTTLPTGRGGRGRKGLGKTTNRPGHGAPLGGRTSETDRGHGNKAARRAGKEVDDTRYDEQVEVDIFDLVLEFLCVEGFAETLEEAEWLMANVLDEEAIEIILGEEQLDEISQKTATKAYAAGTSDEFEGLDDAKRVARNTRLKGRIVKKFGQAAGQHADRAAHAKTFGRKGAGGMPPKPTQEEYMGEAQAARENPEEHEREARKTETRQEKIQRKVSDARKTNPSLDKTMKAYGF